jgi:hypothetical protein
VLVGSQSKELSQRGAAVGHIDGVLVGKSVGDAVGQLVGLYVGGDVGTGAAVGAEVGAVVLPGERNDHVVGSKTVGRRVGSCWCALT